METTSFNYLHTDIPAGMTIGEYRRSRPRRRRRGLGAFLAWAGVRSSG